MKTIGWNVLAGGLAIVAAWSARKVAAALWSKVSDEDVPEPEGEPSVREAVTAVVAGAVTSGLAAARQAIGADDEGAVAAAAEPSTA